MRQQRLVARSAVLALVAAVMGAVSGVRGDVIATGDVSPADPTTWNTSTTAYVGNDSDGTLTVDLDSHLVSNAAFLGYGSGSTGVAMLSGTGSSWALAGGLHVGEWGMGTMTIANGATLSSDRYSFLGMRAGSAGTAIVDGSGSSWVCRSFIMVGEYGAGTLNITHGGSVNTTWQCYVGDGPGSQGKVTVDGAGSALNCDIVLNVGGYGNGVFSITNGGQLNSGGAWIGVFSGAGTVTVDGADSTWNCKFDLAVGAYGTGVLSITNGGQLNSAAVMIGRQTGAGTVTVDGASSKWNCNSEFLVGHIGTGVLRITNGGQVSSGHSSIGEQSGAGTVTIDGATSKWDCTRDLAVGNYGTGVLSIANGGQLSTVGTSIGQHTGAGTVTVDGAPSSWNCSGELAVGEYGSGVLSITNGGQLNSGEAVIGAWGAGAVTIDGASSNWSCSSVVVGNYGAGTLNITNGGQVTCEWRIIVGEHSSSSGLVNFGTNGGTLTTNSLYASPTQFTGNGTIIAHGLVSDGKIDFDAAHGSNQILVWSGTQSNVNVHLDLDASNDLGAGYWGAGTLTIGDGIAISCSTGILGSHAGSTGIANVDGPGSAWNCQYLHVGESGAGILNISNGGNVNATLQTIVASDAGATGSVVFGTGGGTLTTGTMFASPSQFTGVGSVNTFGLVSDGNLLFDASHGFDQTLTWISAPSQVTVHLDMTGNTNAVGALGAGYLGSGTLTIRDGLAINSTEGILGYKAGSTGVAIIDGANSSWVCSDSLKVGYHGAGELTVSRGALAGSLFGYIGDATGSAGLATIDGIGSSWVCQNEIFVGNSGAGTLAITNGGMVRSGGVWLGFGGTGSAAVDGGGSSWTCDGSMYVGNDGNGTLTISSGANVSTLGGVLGVSSSSCGVVNIDGADSVWVCDGGLEVGGYGMGSLTLTHGGKVTSTGGYLSSGFVPSAARIDGTGSSWSCAGDLWMGPGVIAVKNGGALSAANVYMGGNPYSSAVVDGSGSSWTCASVYVGYNGSGTFAVNNGGLVNSVGDGYVGNYGYSGVATVNGSGSSWICDGDLYLGNGADGTLSIANQGAVSSAISHVGYSGGAGVVLVHGAGSSWTCAGGLYVGNDGYGTLIVSHGGVLNSAFANIGLSNGTGWVTVDGAGSNWICGSGLQVGDGGSGTVMISKGGTVRAAGVSIDGISQVSVNVGDGSLLSADTDGITNDGLIRLRAVPAVASGSYTPIVAASWAGTGTVEALGGVWDSSSHVFTVSAAQAGVPGVAVTIDRLAQQRIVITDGTSGDSVVAGFMGTSESSNLTLTGLELTDEQKAALLGVVPVGQGVLDGWTFTADGYADGEPVGLSMKVGNGWSAETLGVWHYDGSEWTPFAAGDLSYDGTYASFTVTGFSGYAVTAAVPEPASVAVLALGMVGLLRTRRRNRK